MSRYFAGTARYPSPPEPGTIVGPTEVGEFLVVLWTDDGVTTFGYATQPEIEASRGKMRSITEMRIG